MSEPKRFSIQARLRAAFAAVRPAALAVLSAALALLASCSQAAPTILSVNLRLVYRQSGVGGTERLSCFALVADEDGTVDLDELYLVNDQAQIFWSVDSAEWVRIDQPGQTWVGSHNLAMPADDAFPRGLYRVVLVDKSGEQTERNVSLDVDADTVKPLPTLTVKDGRYTAVSQYPENSMVFYDGARKLIESRPLVNLEGALADLNKPAGARFIALWAEDEAQIATLTETQNLP